MKSVTIKTPEGEKLIKIYRTKKGYVVESKSVTTDFLRRKRGRKKNVI